MKYSISAIQYQEFLSKRAIELGCIKLEFVHEMGKGILLWRDKTQMNEKREFTFEVMRIFITHEDENRFEFLFFKTDGTYYSYIMEEKIDFNNTYYIQTFTFDEQQSSHEKFLMLRNHDIIHFADFENDNHTFLCKKKEKCDFCYRPSITLNVSNTIFLCMDCILEIFHQLHLK